MFLIAERSVLLPSPLCTHRGEGSGVRGALGHGARRRLTVLNSSEAMRLPAHA